MYVQEAKSFSRVHLMYDTNRGLAGRKTKQKISEDPRNTKWANDTSRIGHQLLSKMGWTGDAATLKPAGESRAVFSHVPIVKDDTRGLGANTPQASASASSLFSAFGSKGLRFVSAGASNELIKRRITEGQDFSSLLQRLNESARKQLVDSATEAVTPVQLTAESDLSLSNVAAGEEKKERKSKKRKRKQEDEGDVPAPTQPEIILNQSVVTATPLLVTKEEIVKSVASRNAYVSVTFTARFFSFTFFGVSDLARNTSSLSEWLLQILQISLPF